MSPGPGRVREVKGRCPSTHGPKAEVDLRAPAGTEDLRQGWEMRVGVNKYTVTTTPNRSLYSATLRALSHSHGAISTGTQETCLG